ncbi:unnamed protein product [Pocillopora meandrina]|uniref:Uncharacterized protein n=1 Tax=Pocillopora meandrina TaxID=46732 RepID=A0AAU9WDW5_9CNID|nr:unnamed protein product [Pocillopora meandrina]
MIDGRLLLNDTKTEFLAIGTRPNLSKPRSFSIEVGNQKIDRSSSYQLSKLQRVQNMAARLITDTMKFDHIKPILMITFKAIHDMAPSYLSNLICIRSSSRYSLRNNDTIFLERPKGVMRTTLGARSFHAYAPALWNSLPAHIRTIDSLALFKESLKTYLFKQAF